MFQNISDFYTPLKEIGIGSSSKVYLNYTMIGFLSRGKKNEGEISL